MGLGFRVWVCNSEDLASRAPGCGWKFGFRVEGLGFRGLGEGSYFEFGHFATIPRVSSLVRPHARRS